MCSLAKHKYYTQSVFYGTCIFLGYLPVVLPCSFGYHKYYFVLTGHVFQIDNGTHLDSHKPNGLILSEELT